MKRISTLEMFGYFYMLLALANYYGPKIGGKWGSWAFAIIATILLFFGGYVRKKANKSYVPPKVPTLSSGSQRKLKPKAK